MSNMNFDNAREEEQLRRMKEYASNNKCYLCNPTESKESIIKNGSYWFIMKNDFPYEGSIYHYLIVSNQHIISVDEIEQDAQLELFEMIKYLKNILKEVPGFTMFVRSGDLLYTGATIDHLHFHFLVADKKHNEESEKLKVKLGYKRPR
jgi:diadenosine tetraphosphate (Ap4A) HIT family hydrolase